MKKLNYVKYFKLEKVLLFVRTLVYIIDFYKTWLDSFLGQPLYEDKQKIIHLTNKKIIVFDGNVITQSH